MREAPVPRRFAALLGASIIAVVAAFAGNGTGGSEQAVRRQPVTARAAFGTLPLSFVRGADGSFVARGAGHSTSVTRDGLATTLARGKGTPRTFEMRLVGADRRARARGSDPLPGRVNVIRGTDRRRWRTGLRTYARVRRDDVYDGIDLVAHGSQDGRVEYDFVVAPNADPGQIGLRFDGASSLALDRGGALVVGVGDGAVRQRAPVAYQRVGRERRGVASSYVVHGKKVEFAVGDYDRRLPLVIDPVLVYSTYVGGRAWDRADSVAVGPDGATYVAGSTTSPDVATTGAYDAGCGTDAEESCNYVRYPWSYWDGGSTEADAFVAKLAPDGRSLEYATYIGGRGEETAEVAVDPLGRAYLAGTTNSIDFPTTAGAYSRDPRGDHQGFVARLGADGGMLDWSTMLGGVGDDYLDAVRVDTSGAAYVSGHTDSADFPRTAGALGSAYRRATETYDAAFVSKVDPTGATLAWSGTFGSVSGPVSLAVDTAGAAYVAGDTSATDFPTTLGAYQSKCDAGLVEAGYSPPCEGDGFVSKIAPDGAALTWSTYLGNKGRDVATGIAVDALGAAYVTGRGTSAFPRTADLGRPGGGGAYVAKLAPTGSALTWSAVVAVEQDDVPSGIVVDSAGRAAIAGTAYSGDLPAIGAPQPMSSPVDCDGLCADAYALRLTADGTAIDGSTYLGGSGDDYGKALALAPGGDAVVAGITDSGDFPTHGALQSSQSAGTCRAGICEDDGFVARLSWDGAGPPVHDDFGDAAPIGGLQGAVSGDTSRATHEPGEPEHGAGAAHSVWYSWTAPTDRRVTFDTTGSAPGTVAAIYRGDGVGALTRVGVPGATVAIDASAGSTYRIAVDGPGGAFVLGWLGVPPANDAFASATELTGASGELVASNELAAHEAVDPAGNHSVWYRWRAPASGRVRWQLGDASFDFPQLWVYTGTNPAHLTMVGSEFDAVAGTEYRIAVSSYYQEETGSFVLTWGDAPPVPANDDLANAQTISGARGTIDADNHRATATTGEPRHSINTPAASIWYRWTAPAAGTYEFYSYEHDAVAAYTGSTYESLRRIALFGGAYSAYSSFSVEAGETVSIAVDDPGSGHPGLLRWRPRSDAPPNDRFAAPVRLDGPGGAVATQIEEASREPGEPGDRAATAWYSWTAPADGPTYVGNASGFIVDVYTGTSVDDLHGVASSAASDGEKGVTFDATAGTEYRIAVSGSGWLIWNQGRPANDDFASAQTLDGADGRVTGDNVLATKESGEPGPADATRTVWFRWTAPRTGDVIFHNRGTRFRSSVSIFTGTGLGDLHGVPTNPSPSGSASSGARDFPAVAGQEYFVRLQANPAGTGSPTMGDYVLSWNRGGGDETPPTVRFLEPDESDDVHQSVEIRAAGDDDAGGVDHIDISVEGSLQNPFSNGIDDVDWDSTKHADGPATITARAFDDAGNSGTAERHVWVDNTAPDTRIDSGPAVTTSARTADFTFSATEAGATFECAIDSTWFRPCAAATSWLVSEGPHTLLVRGIDALANTDATPVRYDWTVGASSEAAPRNLDRPVVSGDAEVGQVLTAGDGTWRGDVQSFSYRWRRCASDGTACTDILGAIDRSYTPTAADGGRALRSVVSAIGAGGTTAVASAATAPVHDPAVPPPANVTAPSFSGGHNADDTLTASPGTWSGAPTAYEYEWDRCNDRGCYDTGRAGAVYALSTYDASYRMRVTVTARNAGGSATRSSEQGDEVDGYGNAGRPVNRTRPAVDGIAAESEPLHVTTGVWEGAVESYSYRWLRCDTNALECFPIGRATAATYTTGPYDVGHRLIAEVTAAARYGSPTATAASEPTAVVAEGDPAAAPVARARPAIRGTARQNETLTGTDGSWSGAPSGYERQWRRCAPDGGGCSDIPGARAATYRLAAADVGQTIVFRVSATGSGGTTTADSDPAGPVGGPLQPPASTSPPTIGGDTVEGRDLTAGSGGWSGEVSGYEYQWLRCNQQGGGCIALSAGTSSVYRLQAADVGSRMVVQVSAWNGAGRRSRDSGPSETVAAAPRDPDPPAAPVNTTAPAVTGEARDGGRLHGSVGGWSGDPTSYAFRWLRCDAAGASCAAIGGADTDTYEPNVADVGHRLRLNVKATGAGGEGSAESEPTDVVAAAPPRDDPPIGAGDEPPVGAEGDPPAASEGSSEPAAGEEVPPPASAALEPPQAVAPLQPPAAPADGSAPRLTLSPIAASRASLARGLRLRLRCSESCTVHVRVLLAARLARRLGLKSDGALTVGTIDAFVRGGSARSVVVRVNRTGRRALERLSGVRFSIHATATDAAGNRSTEVAQSLKPRH